jgi:hypothetical protein
VARLFYREGDLVGANDQLADLVEE